jgi:hypothetical protein
MALPMPQFPSLDAWRKMDETQQDTLIDRMENTGAGSACAR